jgi:hypothetical protein
LTRRLMPRRTVPTARPVCAVSSMIEGNCEVISPRSICSHSWAATWRQGCSAEAGSIFVSRGPNSACHGEPCRAKAAGRPPRRRQAASAKVSGSSDARGNHSSSHAGRELDHAGPVLGRASGCERRPGVDLGLQRVFLM